MNESVRARTHRNDGLRNEPFQPIPQSLQTRRLAGIHRLRRATGMIRVCRIGGWPSRLAGYVDAGRAGYVDAGRACGSSALPDAVIGYFAGFTGRLTLER